MRSKSKINDNQPWWANLLRTAAKPLIALALLLGTLLFCSLPSLVATNNPMWQPSPTQAVDPAMQDMELGLRARMAFTEDPLLSRQEVGIDVRNRVATLWGTVPTAEISYQAVERLRTVLGLTEIRNELHVESADRPPTDRLPPLQARCPLAEPMIRATPSLRQSVARRPDEQSLIASQEVLWRPAMPRPFSRTANEEDAPANRPASSRTATDRTPMPLVSLPGYPAHDSPAAPRSASIKPAENKGGDASKAAEALRLSDPRYHRLQLEVRGGVIYLRGNVFRWDHVYELARAISTLPGVERVVLEKIHADSD